MHRWARMAALLLVMSATMPAWADDAADCSNAKTLMTTNPDRAVSACRRLADQGVAGAQYNLGVMYRKGQGVPQDYAEAAKWFRKAAEQGRADAQSNLGIMYANGLGGLPRDFSEALNWFHKAADQGDAIAQGNLADMYENGRGVPRDFTEAASWYRKAAEQRYALAQYKLGLLYTDGRGVPQDYVQAHMWFSLSALDGETEASALNHRAEIEAKMTTEQIARAQALFAAWEPTTGQ
jgi:uncharacterized protein